MIQEHNDIIKRLFNCDPDRLYKSDIIVNDSNKYHVRIILRKWLCQTEEEACKRAREIQQKAGIVRCINIDQNVDHVFRNKLSILTHLINYNYQPQTQDICIFKPTIHDSIVTCVVKYYDKELIFKNEYFSAGRLKLSSRIEGFLGLFLPHAILTGASLWVEYAINKEYVMKIAELIKFYSKVFNKQYRLNMCALLHSMVESGKKCLSTFSCGVDSFYTLLQNMERIDTLLYVVNYDVYENVQPTTTFNLLDLIKKMGNRYDKQVIICRSNQQQILMSIDYLQNVEDLWGRYLFGPCLFSNYYNLREFNRFLIPSSFQYPGNENRLCGSSFDIDHLYGRTNKMLIYHGNLTRFCKIRYLMSHPHKETILSSLRVCYQVQNITLNCSKCEKCMRTMIMIYLVSPYNESYAKTFVYTPNFSEQIDSYLELPLKGSDKIYQDEVRAATKNKIYGVIDAFTPNIGDTIQTLAAINLLKKFCIEKYYILNREHLDTYNGSEITVIVNGWFMDDITHFPPSPNIKPIFISFHCSNESLIKNNRSYFEQHKPIGCRDLATMALFIKYSIDAYFSGCLTLCFDTVEKKGDQIYFVDVMPELKPYFPNLEGKYICHDIYETENRSNETYRLQLANELLDKYRSAKWVMTSRLHCALPCRAFGTPVYFVHPYLSSDTRFKGLEPIVSGLEDIDEYRRRITESFSRAVFK
jgi:hypothetical protein